MSLPHGAFASLVGAPALVTGAARGIGEGVAVLLSCLGARVVVLDRDGDALSEKYRDPRYAIVVGDIATEAPEELASRVAEPFGVPTLIVNNAGIESEHTFLQADEESFRRVLDTNLRGPWFLTRHLSERLIALDQAAAIVFISSLHDTRVRRRPLYSASKAAVSMLVKELAVEFAPHRIRVNAVSPGAIKHSASPDRDDASEIPLKRYGTPADIATIVAVLLSDELAGYVTGVNLAVDGGLALHTWIAP